MTIQNANSILAVSAPTAIAERAALTNAVDIALNAVERKSTVPVLSNLRLQGFGEYLSIVGTDLDMQLTVKIAAPADSRLHSTIPGYKFRDFLKKAPASDYVSLSETSDTNFALDFEKVKYDLQSISPDRHPVFEWSNSGVSSFEIPGDWLSETIGAVMPAVSTDDVRYYLNGIYMHVSDGKLHFVATDGHKLFKRSTDAPVGCEGMAPVIVPRKAVATLHKLIKGKKAPESVLIAATESKCLFNFDNVELMTKIIDGTFPDYQRVIPGDISTRVRGNSNQFLDGIKGVSLISSEKGRAVKLSFLDDRSNITANNPDTGSAAATADCVVSGDELEIGFNNQYLQTVLSTICPDGGEFQAEFVDNRSPGKFTGTLSDFLAVLMPMKL